MRATGSGIVDLTGLRVSERHQLGPPDAYRREPDLSGGAWRFAALQLGALEALAGHLRQHLRRSGRGAVTPQLARLGRLAMLVEGSRLWVERGALVADAAAGEPERVVAYVHQVRLSVEAACVEGIAIVQRSMGTAAFFESNPAERIMRDLAFYLRQPNPDAALEAAARYCLDAAPDFGDLWAEQGKLT
jgi:alkylation response protein AidB-like acyl-CoA dehydrogenase